MDGASQLMNASIQQPQKNFVEDNKDEFVPNVNRLLVNLKNLDRYDDPFAALDRLRNTLEDAS